MSDEDAILDPRFGDYVPICCLVEAFVGNMDGVMTVRLKQSNRFGGNPHIGEETHQMAGKKSTWSSANQAPY